MDDLGLGLCERCELEESIENEIDVWRLTYGHDAQTELLTDEGKRHGFVVADDDDARRKGLSANGEDRA